MEKSNQSSIRDRGKPNLQERILELEKELSEAKQNNEQLHRENRKLKDQVQAAPYCVEENKRLSDSFTLNHELTAEEEILAIHREMPSLLSGLCSLSNHGKSENIKPEMEWPFLFDSGEQGVWKMGTETCGRMNRWFFVGDIHGDFFALHTLLNLIREQCEDWRICLLGDIVDRGTHSFECFVYLVKWALKYPERIIWIAGNHDICFSWHEEQKVFESNVEPSEFLEYLNKEEPMKAYRQEWGKLFVRLSARLPRAVLFPNGLLATHGGIPHDDLQNELLQCKSPQEKFEFLQSERCLQDFTWTRIHRNPKKIPNRDSKGCQFGFKNFERFCEVVQDVFPVKHLINGHEHPSEGFDLQEKYKVNRAMTLRGFGADTIYSGFAAYQRYLPNLFLAQGLEEGLPELKTVEYAKEALISFYPNTPEKFLRLFPELAPPADPPIVEENHEDMAERPAIPIEEPIQDNKPDSSKSMPDVYSDV